MSETKSTHVVHVFPLPQLLGVESGARPVPVWLRSRGAAVDADPSLPDDLLELFAPPGFRLQGWQAEGGRLVVCWERLPESQ